MPCSRHHHASFSVVCGCGEIFEARFLERFVWEECEGGMCRRNVWEECVGGMCGRNVWEECVGRMCRRNVWGFVGGL